MFEKRICAYCGKEFEGSEWRKTCGAPECQRAYQVASRRRPIKITRETCIVCGKEFDHTQRAGKPLPICSSECHKEYDRNRDRMYMRRWLEKKGKPLRFSKQGERDANSADNKSKPAQPIKKSANDNVSIVVNVESKVCPHCGREFLGSPRRKLCGDPECEKARAEAYNRNFYLNVRRKPDNAAKENEKNKEYYRKTYAKSKHGEMVTGVCRICGKSFTYKWHTRDRVCCDSQECRRANARMLRGLPAKTQTAPQPHEVTIVCADCGAQFSYIKAHKLGKRRRYCDACVKKRYAKQNSEWLKRNRQVMTKWQVERLRQRKLENANKDT
ncbi:MAG: hypothetical protein LBN32_01030 [Helicobacteraceae bacterium]|jgi:predicted nucleic acid-binding Zn ribbon protein|nr:hypothetical protein [Helicobacteraceae bacterium]